MPRMAKTISGGGSAGTTCFDAGRSGGAGAEPLPVAGTPATLDPLQTTSRQDGGAPDLADGWCEALFQTADSIPFEHRGWHTMRMRVLTAIRETKQSASREWKFCDCGGEVHVFENTSTGEVKVRGSRCEDRFCLPCGQKRSYQIGQSLRDLVGKEQALFITLTVRGRAGDHLAGQIKKLSDAWKALRRLPLWSSSIRGGAIMLEVKWSTGSGGHWHPHYHLICHGRWIDQERLRAAWFAITGDSDQVKVKRVRELEESIGYVTKYASKCIDASFVMKPKLLREAMVALRGRRLCACFGTWYGTPLREELESDFDENGQLKPDVLLSPWVYRGTRSTLESHAGGGNAEAADLLRRVDRARALRHALDRRCNGPPDDDGSRGDPLRPPAVAFTVEGEYDGE